MRGPLRVAVMLAATISVTAAMSGCGKAVYEPVAVTDARAACGECHADNVDAYAAGPHAASGCATCHEDAEAHAADPEGVRAVIDWRVDACAECHSSIAGMHLYDDNLKVGPFGGSQRVPPIHKVEEFPEYNTIVAGHGFVRDYREEGAHVWMLEEHYETLRAKFETCLQCKSTKVAWAWHTGTPLTVPADTSIKLTHTAGDGTPARTVDIPAGTVVSLSTDFESYEVSATAVFPDGRVYTSRPSASEDPAEHRDMLWAATIATTKDTMPYGIGCNHCHDPHSSELRLIRPAMADAIASGGVDGRGGVNPYAPDIVNDVASASRKDLETLLCAQCHVEYTCGRSAIDGVVRDHYGWAKAGDLHEHYSRTFGYAQDWTHAIIGAPLIKSQHPEVELAWNSVHYNAGATCVSCHMPRVRSVTGEWVRSHWMTSPYKYHDTAVYGAFAQATGLAAVIGTGPCETCHGNRIADAIAGQRAVYERQKIVQELLALSVTRLGALREATDAGRTVDTTAHEAAIEAHQQAHVLWENLIVSENSMGFHNFDEVFDAMDDAEQFAREALKRAGEALPAEE
ncbi:MAG: ammonia-forming cytochrome c nitrite reductase subunit c552 [Clostridiales bacterium]|nr:ammonia-forming cytochrome c nitrite reductase subunit c552 [Clostridiales bacterium]